MTAVPDVPQRPNGADDPPPPNGADGPDGFAGAGGFAGTGGSGSGFGGAGGVSGAGGSGSIGGTGSFGGAGGVSGNEALRVAAQRAQSTGIRNLPEFTDLPIPGDTANLREGPELHPNCLMLLPLIGIWRGEGEVVYPTIDGPYRFGQQLVICHDGRPFLRYESRTWLLNDGGEVIRPAARETGFWRPQADDTIELLAAHGTGIMELYYGRPRSQTSWELATDAVVRSSSAKKVTSAHRLYGIVEGDLAYVEKRAMVDQPMQPHVSAVLHRVVG